MAAIEDGHAPDTVSAPAWGDLARGKASRRRQFHTSYASRPSVGFRGMVSQSGCSGSRSERREPVPDVRTAPVLFERRGLLLRLSPLKGRGREQLTWRAPPPRGKNSFGPPEMPRHMAGMYRKREGKFLRPSGVNAAEAAVPQRSLNTHKFPRTEAMCRGY